MQESSASSRADDDAVMEALAALGGQFENDDHTSKRKVDSQGDNGYLELPESQVAESPPVLSQIPDEEYGESAQTFSQRVGRGENVEDSYYNGLQVEDYIDPVTLVPYHDEDDEEEDKVHMDEEAVENSLTMLASQMMETNETATRKKAPVSIAAVAPYLEQVDWAEVNDSFDPAGGDDSLQGNTLETILEETPLKNLQPDATTPNLLQSPSLAGRQLLPSEIKDIAEKCFTLADVPPSRAEVESRKVSGTTSRYLHPLERHRAAPPWLPNAMNFISLRGNLVTRGLLLVSTWGPRRN
jgi:hypothetical protein